MEFVAPALDWLLWPGRRIFGFLGLPAESTAAFAALVFVSVYAWLTVLRLTWAFLGRRFGFFNPDHFHSWLWVPWRPLYRLWMRFRDWVRGYSFGRKATAKWASMLETLALLYEPGEIFLGCLRAFGLPWFQPIGIKGDRHLVMVAGTGAGKTTLLMTILSLHKGSALVVDPKGQMARGLLRRCGFGGAGITEKKGGHRSFVLDPQGMVKTARSASWNALEEIKAAIERHGPRVAGDFAAKIAEALIRRDPKEKPFFPQSARAFVEGLILYVLVVEPPERRNLLCVRDLLTNGLTNDLPEGANPFDWLLHSMAERTEFDGAVAKRANALLEGRSRGTFWQRPDLRPPGWIPPEFGRFLSIRISASRSSRPPE